MGKLTDLPNIGPVLADHLHKSGIDNPQTLHQMGAEQAFLCIRRMANPKACLHELEALAGAVEGIRKNLLSYERKAELKRWYHGLRKECGLN